MKTLQNIFESIFHSLNLPTQLAVISISDRPDISDYQCSGSFVAAKTLKQSPIKIAQQIVDLVPSDVKESFDFSILNGFINIVVKDKNLLTQAKKATEIEQEDKKVIIDYGSPNVAKGMHVGHLRSTLIGASLVEIHKAKGHTVTSDNHLGDWGSPMGMVMQKIIEAGEIEWNLATIEALYIEGSKQTKEDLEFKEKVNTLTNKLQQGDTATKALWEKLVETTKKSLKEDYKKMSIHFDTWKGESYYETMMPSMIEELKSKNLTVQSGSDLLIDLGEMSPLILEKSGRYLYHTSDLACVKYKSSHYDEMLYVVDKRQKLHFQQVFAASLKAGYIKSLDEVKHIEFGTINGQDGKPFKTRDGGVLKLKDLINEVSLAVKEKLNPSLTKEEADESVDILTMAVLKFAELKHQRTSDYIFNIEKFVSLEGFTGPSVLYAAVRAKSILSKAQHKGEFLDTVHSPSERNLLFTINKFSHAYNLALKNNEPHHLCEYAYELANSFNSFYHSNPILKESNINLQKHFLACTELYVDTLTKSLKLLGISIPSKM